jgi:hypothetical protein
MSDTPRTDAIVYGRICYVETANDMKVMVAFSRQLERELAAKDAEKYCFASCAFHAAQDAEIAALRIQIADNESWW